MGDKTLLDIVLDLMPLNDDNLAERVITDSDVQLCLSELYDMVKAMDAGQMLLLAVKPGDRVWFTRSAYRQADAPIEAQVMEIKYRGGTDLTNTAVTSGGLLRKFGAEEIGQSVYLRREDAEEALR